MRFCTSVLRALITALISPRSPGPLGFSRIGRSTCRRCVSAAFAHSGFVRRSGALVLFLSAAACAAALSLNFLFHICTYVTARSANCWSVALSGARIASASFPVKPVLLFFFKLVTFEMLRNLLRPLSMVFAVGFSVMSPVTRPIVLLNHRSIVISSKNPPRLR